MIQKTTSICSHKDKPNKKKYVYVIFIRKKDVIFNIFTHFLMLFTFLLKYLTKKFLQKNEKKIYLA